MPISASACAKIILLGEHAVVYHQPAIAIPLSDIRAIAKLDGMTTVPTIRLQDGTITSENTTHPLMVLLQLVCKHLSKPVPNICIQVESQIPIASGLGSGAAIAAALARLICAYYDVQLPLDELNSLVYETEKIFHSTPSGIDNTVVVYEKPVWFIRDVPLQFITQFQPFELLIANTGITAPTYESVSDVRRLYERAPHEYQPIFEQIGELVRRALQAMQQGDFRLLGQMMTANHALLKTLTVSCNELDKLVEVALSHGAYGAKLSGGGRGGNMIVLCDTAHTAPIRQALYNAGAVSVIQTQVK